MKPRALLLALLLATAALLLLGLAIGSSGWQLDLDSAMGRQILLDIRAPRTLGAWAAGALLGLAGAVAQGLFRNPLADPYLLGASGGAGMGVALALAALGLSPAAAGVALRFGLTGAAFLGALAAVLLTLMLARGAEQTARLLLAGIVVGVVLGAATSLLTLVQPGILRSLQAFMLGTTGLMGWPAVAVLLPILALSLVAALAGSRALDALTLGEDTARSLGLHLPVARLGLVATLALATAAAVAQAGLIAFVGLVAPQLVRRLGVLAHGWLLLLSALAGG
ncbi:MAG TPA: iron chelate uptake ABC transporter family permease subunit, partial [Burkholderiaceae bacterium]